MQWSRTPALRGRLSDGTDVSELPEIARAQVVLDTGIAAHVDLEVLRSRAHRVMVVDPGRTTLDDVLTAATESGGGAERVIGLGGGGACDVAKVYRAATSPDHTVRALLERVATGRSRGAWTDLDRYVHPSGGAAQQLLLCPTTYGPCSHRSGVAVVSTSAGLHLLSGAALFADGYFVQRRLLHGAKALQQQGLAESFSRVYGYLCSGDRLVDEDRERLLALARTTWYALQDLETGEGIGRDHVLRLCERSQNLVLRGETDRFAPKFWYLATSLSSVTGYSKIQAVGVVLPALVRWVADGGGTEALRRANRDVLEAVGGDLDSFVDVFTAACGSAGLSRSFSTDSWADQVRSDWFFSGGPFSGGSSLDLTDFLDHWATAPRR